jgi:hypothetical protein
MSERSEKTMPEILDAMDRFVVGYNSQGDPIVDTGMVTTLVRDGEHWIMKCSYPDYAAAGKTKAEARRNFWQGLALSMWTQWLVFGRITLGRKP